MRLEEEKTKKEYQLNDSDYKICANSQQDILRKDNKHLQKKENSDNHNTRSDLNLTSSDNNPNNIPRGTPTSITNTPSSRSLSYMSTSTNTPSFTQGSMIASNSGPFG
ncbi:hypothetical protein FG379_002382 [Cryptosporidium bovis]|uniref:uncharacterized protein n=1 Tax=Cryptosporidium bovis TaxID=310047 RepID=UPI00351A5887|nr:hypothetical protein FG379_002382 [Cryptosporidium bovis]